jgi:hypothetical protein
MSNQLKNETVPLDGGMTIFEFVDHAMADAGMTKDEAECMFFVFLAASYYAKLPIQHRDEPRQFTDAIHVLQQILSMRVSRRDYPYFYRNEAQND